MALAAWGDRVIVVDGTPSVKIYLRNGELRGEAALPGTPVAIASTSRGLIAIWVQDTLHVSMEKILVKIV